MQLARQRETCDQLVASKIWRFLSLSRFSLYLNCSKSGTNVLIEPSFQNLQDDKDTSADEDIKTETIILSWELPVRWTLLGGMGNMTEVWVPGTLRKSNSQLVKKWDRRQSSISMVGVSVSDGGDERRRWKFLDEQKLCTVLLLLGWWGCGGGTKGSSAYSLHLTLSLITRGTAHCAKQAAIWTWDAMPTLW